VRENIEIGSRIRNIICFDDKLKRLKQRLSAMGCGSSSNVPQDPEKFPSHLLFQFTDVVVKPVSLQRNDQLSKEHMFQILLESFRSAGILLASQSVHLCLSRFSCSWLATLLFTATHAHSRLSQRSNGRP
jgi:hypothetical protein